MNNDIKLNDDTFQNLEQLVRMVRLLFAQSFESVIMTTANKDSHEIIFANPAFCKMTGYSEEELLGQSPKILQGEKTNRHIMQNLKRCLANDSPFHGAAINYRKDGATYHVEWKINSVYDQSGELIAYFSVQRDLTYLKKFLGQVKKSTDTFRNFLKNVNRSRYKLDIDADLQQSMVEATRQEISNMAIFSPSLRKDEDTELFDDELFLFDDEPISAMPIEQKLHEISAAEFQETINPDNNDILNLCSVLAECNSSVEILRSSSNHQQAMSQLIVDLQDFSSLLFFLDEFVDISTVLGELGRCLEKVNQKQTPKFVVETLGGLVLDLNNWMDAIFIHQTSKNIHEYDASIIGSARQLIALIN